MTTSDINATKRTDIYNIDPRNVVVVNGFNVRREFDIDELKEQIKLQGVLNPITVVPFKDEDGNDKYRLVDGERRLRATLKAIEEGADIKRIKALFLPRNTKEEDLLIEQMMRNEGKNFTEYEQALMFQRFRDKFGYTQTEIAGKFGKSVTFVSNCLSLLNLAPEIQDKLADNKISTSAVRTIVKLNDGDEAKQVKAVETAITEAESKGKTKATVRHIEPSMKSQKELKKVIAGFQTLYDATVAVGIDITPCEFKHLFTLLNQSSDMDDFITRMTTPNK